MAVRTRISACLISGLLLGALLLSSCGGGGGGGGGPSAGTPVSGGDNSPPPPDATSGPPIGSVVPGPRPEFGKRSFVAYESGPVRPLALSADRSRLFAVNTPDNRLEVFEVSDAGLQPVASVPVGMEPVAVAAAADGTIWVVNHLSDSVSIVDPGGDADTDPPHVVSTLWVGDEPRDIVFAGAAKERAFVTTAHRGQNSPVNAQLTTEGVGRADVWVFDTQAAGASAGGDPLTVLTHFGDTPRALAVSPDGSRVYAAVFRSGNRTTTLPPADELQRPAPHQNTAGVAAPKGGLIAKFDGRNWVDELGTIWDNLVPFSLPDYDLFEIDALADPPQEIGRTRGLGTTLFNIAVNPVSGVLYVSNTEARNHVRFSGLARSAATTVRGHVADNRISVVRNGGVSARHLNKHLDFSRDFGTEAERAASLSMPLDMAVSADGSTLYVAAFGSGKIGVFATAELEDDSFQPDSASHITLSGGGPAGIVLDEPRRRAYVLTRFDNSIALLDLDSRQEIDKLSLFNPEPDSIVAGRPFLYDANLTSSRGNDSCASCHLFGDNDALAWDLGDPDGSVVAIPNTFISISPAAQPDEFHPMKGPMTTQSMRGLAGHGPMHWRGDRSGDNRKNGETLEEAAFKEFNEAFEAFMARDGQLSDEDMQKFTDFAMQLAYPPNPIRALNNSLRLSERDGQALFRSGVVRVQTGLLEVCTQCHVLDVTRGQFGTGGLMSDNSQVGERNFKIPHFRDQYQKVGMFGWAFEAAPATGNQVRGFGYNHDGATAGNFVIADLGMPADDLAALRAFLFVFPTESPPVVGQQLTMRADNVAVVAERLDLLIERALVTAPVPECDLIAKGLIGGVQRGWLFNDQSLFDPDRASENAITRGDLEALASVPGQEITFTCAPWGSGQRMGLDRDEDGTLDGDE